MNVPGRVMIAATTNDNKREIVGHERFRASDSNKSREIKSDKIKKYQWVTMINDKNLG